MKKIVFVCNSLANGGVQRVVSLLAANLKDKFTTVILCGNKMEKEYAVEGVTVNYLNDDENVGSIRKSTFIKGIRKFIKEQKPDVVVSFEYFVNMNAVIAALGLKTPLIVSERNDPSQLKRKRLLNLLRDLLYRKADALVCQTDEVKAYFSKRVQRRAVVILNPIKSGLPKYSGEDSKEIINFCRLNKQKNLPLLIDAFAIFLKDHEDYKLKIYGDGGERDGLNEYIAQKGLTASVTVLPATTEIYDIASKCKMFVSSSDYEGLSNSMLEAMAMGMPVVCTDCAGGGARTVIDGGVNGLLVPVRDAEAMAAAMAKIADDGGFSARLSGNAAKINERLNEENIANEWATLVERVTEKTR